MKLLTHMKSITNCWFKNRSLKNKNKMLEELVKLYKYDKLTGFLLRHDYEIDIKESCSNLYNTYLTIIDINRLHYINETYGYVAGDKHIITVGKAIKRRLGDGVAYRIGGDEFAVITHANVTDLNLPNTVSSTVLLSEYTDYREIMEFVKEDLATKKAKWYHERGIERRSN